MTQNTNRDRTAENIAALLMEADDYLEAGDVETAREYLRTATYAYVKVEDETLRMNLARWQAAVADRVATALGY